MKFAYLVIAHDNPEQLKILLKLLDYTENEIFFLIDKKNESINIPEIKKSLKNAKINVYKVYNVFWGDINLTKSELFLLEKATKTYHDYYHLISNADLPLKPHEKILDFFIKNNGTQFVHFDSNMNYTYKNNCIYYHFLYYNIVRTKNIHVKRILQSIENTLLKFQKSLSVKRKFYNGSQWFSITHDCAIDFLHYKRQILNKVKWTIASDELVLQNFLKCYAKKEYKLYGIPRDSDDHNTPLKRAIDWKRGRPYTWRERDFEELINSDNLFGRKFDITKNRQLVLDIVNYVTR